MSENMNPQAPTSTPFADETTSPEAKERLRQLFRSGGTPSEAAANTVAVENFDDNPFANMKAALLLQAEDSLLMDKSYLGDVFGVGCAETGKYYLLANAVSGNPANFPKLGIIVTEAEYHALMADPKSTREGCTLFGAYVNGGWTFRLLDEDRSYISLLPFGLVNKLFSRNSGLFESDSMMEKTAVIIGQGSAGSMIALYLARSGVGRFILVDADTLEIHNLCRHQLDSRDLGRYKVDAMRDAILRINPKAQVEVFCGWLQEAPMELFTKVKDGIVVGTADDREANALANDLAKVMGVPYVAIGGWTRCHAGEVFYWLPGSDLPTYGEAFSQLIAEAEAAPKTNHDYFADDHDRETLNFETGTAVDLGFISMAGLKFILDLINLNNDHYTTRVLDDYTNYTLICNTNKAEIGGENAVMFPKPLGIYSATFNIEERACG